MIAFPKRKKAKKKFKKNSQLKIVVKKTLFI